MKTERVGCSETPGDLNKRFRFFLRTHLAVAVVALASQTLPAAAPTFLHTQGQDIGNDQGESILLRGVGLGNWMRNGRGMMPKSLAKPARQCQL